MAEPPKKPEKPKREPKEVLRKALQDRREKTNGHQPTTGGKKK